MPFIQKDDMDIIQETYNVLKAKKSGFCDAEIETLDNFCTMMEDLLKEQKNEKIKRAEYMRGRRNNPETREKYQKIDRRAIAKFRGKDIKESEPET